MSLSKSNIIADSPLKKVFYDCMDWDRIKINWNKTPIPMKLFLSFLNVDVIRSTDHLGSNTGWTLLKNEEYRLKVSGGIVSGVEYLDSLEYGQNFHNPYNNCVNPFYLFDILTDEGKKFFVEYYKKEIDKVVSDAENSVTSLERQLQYKRELLAQIKAEVKALAEYNNTVK